MGNVGFMVETYIDGFVFLEEAVGRNVRVK